MMRTIKKIFTALGVLVCLSLGLALSARAAGEGPILVAAGWNLLGNGSGSPLDVATAFGDANKVITVWQWIAAKGSWGFYSPADADSGAAYAGSKGFELLTTIPGGQGFWLNAKSAFTVPLPAGSILEAKALQTGGAQALPSGWSLISCGGNMTATQFNQALMMTAAPSGEKPVNVTTLWAWDTAQGGWNFYSPSLAAEGGTAQADYLAAKGYLAFGAKVITPVMGVWVNTHKALGPAPVLLGSAADFVILAKTAVSTTGATAVVGNIGISPAAASYITGFGMVAEASNVFALSSLVTGNIYAANHAAPTPSKLTTAIGDMEIAFTDAAGRPSADYTELYAGDMSGKTLAPGLYKWSSGLLITMAGVTLEGGANDVWILQIAQDLMVGNGAMITLSGGAQAKNIFWQVSGGATLGAGADFKGILMSQTMISLNTGAVVNGALLAQSAVTLNANAVSQ